MTAGPVATSLVGLLGRATDLWGIEIEPFIKLDDIDGLLAKTS